MTFECNDASDFRVTIDPSEKNGLRIGDKNPDGSASAAVRNDDDDRREASRQLTGRRIKNDDSFLVWRRNSKDSLRPGRH